MSKLNVVRRCYNCGVVLQSDDRNKDGYIDRSLLESSDSTVLFCEKCWKQQRYNIAPREPKIDQQFLDMLRDAQASDALIVYVVDIFSFETSFISQVTEIIEGLNLIVIANKRDLLPEKANDGELREYVAHRFRVAKLKVTADDVILTSLTSSFDAKPLIERMSEARRRHDVYIIGAIGAGKTILLSSILRNYSNSSRMNIITSNYPGTTLKVMQIPVDSSSAVYDTPGTSIENSMLSKIDVKAARDIVPSVAIKPRKLVLTERDSLFIGGLARLELINGKKQMVTCYFSQDVTLKKNVRNHDESFIRAIERESVNPVASCARAMTDFDAFEIVVDEQGSRDIGIEGLGWVNFQGDQQNWRIYVPKGVSIYTTRAKIK